MTDILETIAAYKRVEVARRKQVRSLTDLEDAARSVSPPRGFRHRLNTVHAPGGLALIAEIKRHLRQRG